MLRQANNIFNINNSVGYILDVDASKVIEAVRSTGVVITPAMRHYAHYLISNMKNIGSWQLSSAVYGMVGGTAASHKWNWKDLRDLDAAFRLTYVGGITHSANGMQGDGSTGSTNTSINTSTLTYNNTHLSIYSNIANNIFGLDIGSIDQTVNPDFSFSLLTRTGNITYSDQYTYENSDRISISNTIGLGYFMGTRTNLNHKLFINGSVRGSNSTNSSSPFLSRLLYISHPGFFTNGRYSFASIGAGLTDTQATQQSQIVTNAQSILNRV